MSNQLAISATFSVLMMALFALSGADESKLGSHDDSFVPAPHVSGPAMPRMTGGFLPLRN